MILLVSFKTAISQCQTLGSVSCLPTGVINLPNLETAPELQCSNAGSSYTESDSRGKVILPHTLQHGRMSPGGLLVTTLPWEAHAGLTTIRSHLIPPLPPFQPEPHFLWTATSYGRTRTQGQQCCVRLSEEERKVDY